MIYQKKKTGNTEVTTLTIPNLVWVLLAIVVASALGLTAQLLPLLVVLPSFAEYLK